MSPQWKYRYTIQDNAGILAITRAENRGMQKYGNHVDVSIEKCSVAAAYPRLRPRGRGAPRAGCCTLISRTGVAVVLLR